MKFLSIITLSVLLLIGCSKSVIPTAAFSYTGTKIAPAAITFINNSTNATSYSWAFGDGGTSTESAPAHTYTAAGSYTVTLTAKNGDEVNTSSQTIVVTDPVYTKMRIVKMVIEQMPMTNGSGQGWDIADGPDLWVDIFLNSTSVWNNYSNGVSNVTISSFPILFNVNYTMDINNSYTLRLMDADGAVSDNISNATFSPSDYITVDGIKYQKAFSVSYKTTGGTVQQKISFQVEWL